MAFDFNLLKDFKIIKKRVESKKRGVRDNLLNIEGGYEGREIF